MRRHLPTITHIYRVKIYIGGGWWHRHHLSPFRHLGWWLHSQSSICCRRRSRCRRWRWRCLGLLTATLVVFRDNHFVANFSRLFFPPILSRPNALYFRFFFTQADLKIKNTQLWFCGNFAICFYSPVLRIYINVRNCQFSTDTTNTDFVGGACWTESKSYFRVIFSLLRWDRRHYKYISLNYTLLSHYYCYSTHN